jgi:sugar/nucleoside kinase (ribokinase family)
VVHRDGVTARYPGFPQRPVDTNGAGDTHTGVLVAEIARRTDWSTAAIRANAAGAIKVTRRGPDTAPTAAEVDEFLAVHG